jgi:predicted O-methyltransferase YrrM
MNLTQRITALVPKMPGWCTPEKANDLALAVLKMRGLPSAEVGVFAGRSCIGMAMAHQQLGAGKIYAIDPWDKFAATEGYDDVNAAWWGALDHEAIYQQFLAYIKTENVGDFIDVQRKRSDDAQVPDELGVAHLDGQHTDQTTKDVQKYATRVVKGGFVFLDDIQWAGGGVARAMDVLLAMGFVKLFDRDTGAMFQRTEIPGAKKSRGWPKGKPRRKKVTK